MNRSTKNRHQRRDSTKFYGVGLQIYLYIKLLYQVDIVTSYKANANDQCLFYVTMKELSKLSSECRAQVNSNGPR